eukprot:COSAG03_NODE_2920_length_2356_cov_2.706690_2_plen_76_part_00
MAADLGGMTIARGAGTASARAQKRINSYEFNIYFRLSTYEYRVRTRGGRGCALRLATARACLTLSAWHRRGSAKC